jgi:ACS family hexuronate transporter-like MFS transporter
VPLLFVLQVGNALVVVLMIGLATAGHQAFSSNIFTMISDLYPRRAVATVAGLGGCAGAIGGMLIASATGLSLEYLGSYMPLMIYAGLAYLIAFTAIHLLVPKMDPAPVSEA